MAQPQGFILCICGARPTFSSQEPAAGHTFRQLCSWGKVQVELELQSLARTHSHRGELDVWGRLGHFGYCLLFLSGEGAIHHGTVRLEDRKLEDQRMGY